MFFPRGESYFRQDRIRKTRRQDGTLKAWQNAALVYRTLLETTMEHYDSYLDEDGSIGLVMQNCCEKLAPCLENLGDAAVREPLLQVLFDLYRYDVSLGGYGLSDQGAEVLLNQTSEEERRRVAGWARDEMVAGSGWAKKAYGHFVFELEQDVLSDEQFLALCREAEMVVDPIWGLLELGRSEKALDAEIRQIVQKRAEEDDRLVQWLRDDAQTRGDADTSLALSRQLFWKNPSLNAYEQIHEAAGGQWDAVRVDLLDELEQKDRHDLLARIYLADQEIDAALREVYHIGDSPYSRWSGLGLRLEIAEAAEDEHPDRAADIYLERACDLIEQRGRGNYRQAAEHLSGIQAIYQRTGEPSKWQQIITAIRTENDNLPALQDELDKAGL